LIQWFPKRTRFFAPIQNSYIFKGLRESCHKFFCWEGSIEMNIYHSHFLPFACQKFNCFADGGGGRTHYNHNCFCICGTGVFHKLVLTACCFSELVHIFLNNAGHCGIEWIYGFAPLEVNICVLSRATQNGSIWSECSCAVSGHKFIVY